MLINYSSNLQMSLLFPPCGRYCVYSPLMALQYKLRKMVCAGIPEQEFWWI